MGIMAFDMSHRKQKKICKNCKFFNLLGSENSGLLLMPDEEWVYGVGECKHPDSVHGGYIARDFHGVPIYENNTPRKNLAEWCSCEHWKRAAR